MIPLVMVPLEEFGQGRADRCNAPVLQVNHAALNQNVRVNLGD
jgi:hypothetical protein